MPSFYYKGTDLRNSVRKSQALNMQTFSPEIQASAKRLSQKNQWRLYIVALVLNDVFILILSLQFSYLVRFMLDLPIFHLEITPIPAYYTHLIFILVPIWLIIFTGVGLYQKPKLLGGTTEYALVFKGTSIGLFLLIVAGFLAPDFVIARGWVIVAWISSFFFTCLGRFVLRRVIYSARLRGYFTSQALIVGANDEGLSLAKQLIEWPTSGMNLIGFVDKKYSVGTILPDGLPVLGSLDQLDRVINAYQIEELILATSSISTRDKMVDIFQRYGTSGDVNLRLSSGLYEIITTGLTVSEIAYVPLVYVNKVRLTGTDWLIKMVLDYGLTVPALFFLWPLFLLIAIIIKIDSPGPAFHRRQVMGVNGKKFCALKFRTMYEDGEEILEAHPHLKEQLEQNRKLKNDPRVTRVGHILRKYSLDELPQFFNVLFNEMSLIGPRMISPEEMKNYERWGLNLLTVKPGITGLWQVSGRSDISYEERVRLDMHYIRNWSIWLDFQLLLRTIPVVLHGKGAY
jgi:exopolysaccharide biosynthesis polyprenyl glycosylphosphotransferase